MIGALLILFFTLYSFNSEAGISIPTNQVDIQEGKRVYIINCVRCHNRDPNKAGAIGPELATSPLEVFRTKVPKGTYPSGYRPKRPTKIMPRLPHLTNKVDQVYKYIESLKDKK